MSVFCTVQSQKAYLEHPECLPWRVSLGELLEQHIQAPEQGAGWGIAPSPLEVYSLQHLYKEIAHPTS